MLQWFFQYVFEWDVFLVWLRGECSLETGERGGYGTGVAGRVGGEESEFVSRDEVDVYLKGVRFPAAVEELIENAESLCAPQKVIDALDRLPKREYGGAAEVEAAVERLP